MAKVIMLAILICFSSCNNSSIIQTNQDYTILEENTYDFTNGMKISATTIMKIYKKGNLSDSIMIKTFYQYNKKGLLIKETYSSDSSMRLYSYNAKDSLISDMSINNEGDTTLWREYDYYEDGRKTKFLRLLTSNVNESDDENGKISDDTLYERTEYIYEKGECKTVKKYDVNNILVEQIVYSFDNSRKIKEIFYGYSDTIRFIKKTTFYDYSKSNSFPDFYSLDTQNDTIEKCRNTFNKDNLVFSAQYFDYDNVCISSFFTNGKITKNVFVDNKEKIKRTEYSSYYSDGNEKQRLIITETIILD